MPSLRGSRPTFGHWTVLGAVGLCVTAAAVWLAVFRGDDQRGAAIGYIDVPKSDTVTGPQARISGWALDPAGVEAVEILLDGRTFRARYGTPRPDVAALYPDFPNSAAAGFEFSQDLAGLRERHELTVVVVNRLGQRSPIGKKWVIDTSGLDTREPLLQLRPDAALRPFYVAIATSGIAQGGADEIRDEYSPYVSRTIRVAIRVPILYMRTTTGPARDWAFDPDFDVSARCGKRRVAEDSLRSVVEYAVREQLPVLFTLNGGIWADAACDAPQWDVNDMLEADAMNCQWNESDEVMSDDYLRRLPGSQEAPELARSLTFNVYASTVRHYKKRNLQQAGRLIAQFAQAHPDLFVGINLDPDTYINPFFSQAQWYDYNPNTLRQFREWLNGTGPYAPRPASCGEDESVPDLSAYRRKQPLTLQDINRLSGRSFGSWNEVDPPRAFRLFPPFWMDGWTHEWERFRRHLVDLHYDELSTWVAEVGIPTDKIFSSQGFMEPHALAKPFAVRLDSPTQNYDSGGMSVEGAMPRHGHLGAIVYGASAINDIRMETSHSLFRTLREMDDGWAVAEFNTASLTQPKALPGYPAAYRALREMFNFGARFVSPMAWNGSNGLFVDQPGFVAFTALRNTPLEQALRDFMISHANLPAGAKLWTFGSSAHPDQDEWVAESPGRLHTGPGYLELTPAPPTRSVTLLSPADDYISAETHDLLVIGISQDDRLAAIEVHGRDGEGPWLPLTSATEVRRLEVSAAGYEVPLAWPEALSLATQLRVRLTFRPGVVTPRLEHVALHPRSHPSQVPADNG